MIQGMIEINDGVGRPYRACEDHERVGLQLFSALLREGSMANSDHVEL